MIVWRHYLVVLIFLGVTLALCGRVVFLSVTERAFLQDQGDSTYVSR